MAEDLLERSGVGEGKGLGEGLGGGERSRQDVKADVALCNVNLWGCRKGHRGLRFMIPKHTEAGPFRPAELGI